MDQRPFPAKSLNKKRKISFFGLKRRKKGVGWGGAGIGVPLFLTNPRVGDPSAYSVGAFGKLRVKNTFHFLMGGPNMLSLSLTLFFVFSCKLNRPKGGTKGAFLL